ncbi:conserved hypothetical protein [Stigmatella aurantiaca DW4/3-1]|uniref:Uncharacterized protein n=1 Tax=Stigmatella aurantiaca (strain DW4/3-1) TaxID=378806 RepID=Q09AN8_STIAD|nr:conserved hypothetical protein [Stigmatella aurantiaca DW4/3-1]
MAAACSLPASPSPASLSSRRAACSTRRLPPGPCSLPARPLWAARKALSLACPLPAKTLLSTGGFPLTPTFPSARGNGAFPARSLLILPPRGCPPGRTSSTARGSFAAGPLAAAFLTLARMACATGLAPATTRGPGVRAVRLTPRVPTAGGALVSRLFPAGQHLIAGERVHRACTAPSASPPLRTHARGAWEASGLRQLRVLLPRLELFQFLDKDRVLPGHFGTRQAHANDALDGSHSLLVPRGDKRRGTSTRTGSRRAANPVDVIFRRVGQVEVDDVADVLHIQAARRDVGGHQAAVLPSPESFERLPALPLGAVRVNGRGLVTRSLEHFLDLLGPFPGAGEDQHAELVLGEQAEQQRVLLRGFDLVQPLHGPRGGRPARGDLHPDGLAQHLLGETRHIVAKGGGEEKRLTLAGQGGEDLLKLGHEAHLQRPVRLIQHEHAHRGEIRHPLLQQVGQPARGGEHQRGPLSERLHLGAHVRAASHHRLGQATRLPEKGGLLSDLQHQFARGGEHQPHRAPFPGQALDQRQQIGGGLAGARDRATDDVPPGQRRWDGLGLDGGGRGEAGAPHRIERFRREAEGLEGGAHAGGANTPGRSGRSTTSSPSQEPTSP